MDTKSAIAKLTTQNDWLESECETLERAVLEGERRSALLRRRANAIERGRRLLADIQAIEADTVYCLAPLVASFESSPTFERACKGDFDGVLSRYNEWRGNW